MRALGPLLLLACAGPADPGADDTGAPGHAGAPAALPTAPYDPSVDTYPWGLPDWAPRPPVPGDNPMTEAKVALGRHLFYDLRLSGNGTQACASCHDQARAFTDGTPVATGSTGDRTLRNSMGLLNVAYMTSMNWANPSTLTLESQALVPLYGESPVELGLTGHEDLVLERLAAEPRYDTLFADAFPEDDEPLTLPHAVLALASFVRSIVGFDTPVDRLTYGDGTPLDPLAAEGMDLFYSERLECHHCHGSWNFSLTTASAGQTFPQLGFQNTGLYDLDGRGAYPPGNTGLQAFTGYAEDMGRFRPPTLRNVALTAPYMHDGSVATLEEVVDLYAAGGRLITEGPLAGDGRASPLKSRFITGFTLTERERAALIAFLESLTDEASLTDARWSDPW